MSVAYTIEFRIREGERARFLALLSGVLDAMRAEATFRCATLSEDPDDPSRFLLHEVWADHDEVVSTQLSRPYRRAWHEALPELLERERVISVWRPIHGEGAANAAD